MKHNYPSYWLRKEQRRTEEERNKWFRETTERNEEIYALLDEISRRYNLNQKEIKPSQFYLFTQDNPDGIISH